MRASVKPFSCEPPNSKRLRAGPASSNIANHVGLRRQSGAATALSPGPNGSVLIHAPFKVVSRCACRRTPSRVGEASQTPHVARYSSNNARANCLAPKGCGSSGGVSLWRADAVKTLRVVSGLRIGELELAGAGG